jgi:hypothetical protein
MDDTKRETSRHHGRHRRIDDGIPQKLKLRTEAQQFYQQFQIYLKMTNVHQNM